MRSRWKGAVVDPNLLKFFLKYNFIYLFSNQLKHYKLPPQTIDSLNFLTQLFPKKLIGSTSSYQKKICVSTHLYNFCDFHLPNLTSSFFKEKNFLNRRWKLEQRFLIVLNFFVKAAFTRLSKDDTKKALKSVGRARSKTAGEEILSSFFIRPRSDPIIAPLVVSRRATILPIFCGFSFRIYNGIDYSVLKVKKSMINTKFGEYCLTKAIGRRIHSRRARKPKKR